MTSAALTFKMSDRRGSACVLFVCAFQTVRETYSADTGLADSKLSSVCVSGG